VFPLFAQGGNEANAAEAAFTSSEPLLGQPAFGPDSTAPQVDLYRAREPHHLPGSRRPGYDQNSSQA
jgi:hypothetical protein